MLTAMRIQSIDKDASPVFRLRVFSRGGFTLAEVLISIMIVGLVFGGILAGYVQSARRAEWTGYSLAAQAYGIQQLEQARSAVWDVSSASTINQITQLNLLNRTHSGTYPVGQWKGHTWTNIDVPYSGNNFIRATNYVTISNVTLSVSPPVSLQSVRVDTVWRFKQKNHTNTLVNYYAPDL